MPDPDSQQNIAQTNVAKKEAWNRPRARTRFSNLLLQRAGRLQDIIKRIRAMHAKEKANLLEEIQVLRLDAITDELTGLPNRKPIERTIWGILAQMSPVDGEERKGYVPKELAMILMDIDHFKLINDTYGHPVGDIVLQKVANIVKDLSRVEDQKARWGGEEFVLIMPDMPVDKAIERAELIRTSVEALRFEQPGLTDLRVTISAGVTSTATCGTNFTELVRASDAAMYASKSAGRNTVSAYDCETDKAMIHQNNPQDWSSFEI